MGTRTIKMNTINLFCLWTGYTFWAIIALYLSMIIYIHSWFILTMVIAEVRMSIRGNYDINWMKLPWRFIIGWLKAWRDPFFTADQTHTYKDIGKWVSPSHIWSFGTYTWFEKKAEKALDNVEKSL